MAEGLSMQTMSNRMHAAIREKAEMKSQEQRRSLMYLVGDFLRQQGLFKTLTTFVEEGQLSDNYQLCDNTDLEIIFLEYCDYYKARFKKAVNICKCVDKNNQSIARVLAQKPDATTAKSVKPKQRSTTASEDRLASPEKNSPGIGRDDFALTITSLSGKPGANPGPDTSDREPGFPLLRPLGNLYPEASEFRQIAQVIEREIVGTNLKVHWKDIHGLDECINQLKEATVYPRKYPEAFRGVFSPWKGILLYGPPGTGKTMLAKAVATESGCTFFNVSASSLVSKWRGESEKYIRVLFDLAAHHAPSIVFIDEIDWLAGGGGGGGGGGHGDADNSEPARRFRAELLSRLDGLLSDDDSRVTLLAATNVPWNLDPALLRRLENHVRVDVPDSEAIRSICDAYTSERVRRTSDYANLLESLRGFSGADIKRLFKKAWFVQMKDKWDQMGGEANRFEEEAASIVDLGAVRDAKADFLLTATKRFDKKHDDWVKSFGGRLVSSPTSTN